jgi:hypothetical protein
MIEESQSPKKTPGAVIVAGSIWLTVATLVLMWAASLLVLFGVLNNFVPGGTEGMPPAPPIAKPLEWTFQHYVLSGTVLGAVALLGIYSGIQFLRLKPWARSVLEAGGWTVIALSVAWGLWRSQFWIYAATGANDLRDTVAARLIIGLFLAAYFAVFPAVFVWLLRSRMIRPAFSPDAQDARRIA